MIESEPVDWILLAHLLRPQGRKGELLAELHTDYPDRFLERPRVYLASPGYVGPVSGTKTVDVLSFWLPLGRNQGRIVLHFAGVGSITQAEDLAGNDVLIPAEERVELTEDAAYIDELAGCILYDRGKMIGTIEDVQFATSADGSRRVDEMAPLLMVRAADRGEVLVPYVKAFLISVDCPNKRIEMQLPEGLVDINK